MSDMLFDSQPPDEWLEFESWHKKNPKRKFHVVRATDGPKDQANVLLVRFKKGRMDGLGLSLGPLHGSTCDGCDECKAAIADLDKSDTWGRQMWKQYGGNDHDEFAALLDARGGPGPRLVN